MKDEALRLALEALEALARYENPQTKIQIRKKDGGSIVTMYPHKVASEAITAIKAALEAKDEPDKYAMDIECTKCGAKQSGVLTVHTNPPQRTWVGLTDIDYAGLPLEQVGLVRWAEAKLKEKNT